MPASIRRAESWSLQGGIRAVLAEQGSVWVGDDGWRDVLGDMTGAVSEPGFRDVVGTCPCQTRRGQKNVERCWAQVPGRMPAPSGGALIPSCKRAPPCSSPGKHLGWLSGKIANFAASPHLCSQPLRAWLLLLSGRSQRLPAQELAKGHEGPLRFLERISSTPCIGCRLPELGFSAVQATWKDVPEEAHSVIVCER